MKKHTYYFFCLTFLFVTTLSLGQSEKDVDQYYIWFDAITSDSNTSLYNGSRYIEEYRTENGNHKFFLSEKYLAGSITYNNQTFYDIEMRYDIYRDNIIVKLPNQSTTLAMKLIKEKVNSFTLFGYKFVNVPKFISDKAESTTNSFYRVLHETPEISLYKKHFKTRAEYIKDYKLYSKFYDKSYYAIKYKGEYKSVGKKKDFIKIFPNLKKLITTYYRNERNLYKSDKDKFYTELIEKINSSNATNQN